MVLTLRGKGAEEETLRFEADSVIVGSDDLCDVIVPDDGVDSRQAVLVAREDHVEVFDIGISGGQMILRR